MFGMRSKKTGAAEPTQPQAEAVAEPVKEPRSTEMKCTYCGGTKFFEGPSGGMSTNVLCGNNACRHWFNYTPGFAFDDLNRVEPTKEEHDQQEIDRKTAAARVEEERFQEGAKAYREGKPIRSLMHDKPYGNYGASAWNVERLIGYTQAMQEDLHRLRLQTRFGKPSDD